jgi:hypothetical protein
VHVLQLLDRPERPAFRPEIHDGLRLRGADARELLQQLRSGRVEVDRKQIDLHDRRRRLRDLPRRTVGLRLRPRDRAEKDSGRDEREDVPLLARHDPALPAHAAGRVPFRYRWTTGIP